MRRQAVKIAAGLCLGVLLAGCGFQLRGEAPLPFTSAFVEASPISSLAPVLRKSLEASHKLAASKEWAAISIRLSGEAREKNILSLSGTGKVREYRLIHRVTVAAIDKDGREVLAPSPIQLNRDFSYSDEQIMAKEAEEALLHKEMEQDILRQILRRLGYVQKL
jgi:LPS-assembly lipoprotein